jgi:hypothetical protein
MDAHPGADPGYALLRHAVHPGHDAGERGRPAPAAGPGAGLRAGQPRLGRGPGHCRCGQRGPGPGHLGPGPVLAARGSVPGDPRPGPNQADLTVGPVRPVRPVPGPAVRRPWSGTADR